MKKIVILLFVFLLILSLNGNAAETVPIDLVSFDNSSSVEKIHNIPANKTSDLELEQSMHAIPEPIAMFILGAGLIGLGIFSRKKLSHREFNMSTHLRPDNNGRRLGLEQRKFSYDFHIPERRPGEDLRSAKDIRLKPKIYK